MIKKRNYITIAIISCFSLILVSCGANNPNSVSNVTTSTVSKQTNIASTNPNLTINAYQSTTHGFDMTQEAIKYLLSPESTDLTPKQKKLLEANKLAIIVGNTNEDSNLRDLNHFWDPIHDTPLTTDAGNQTLISISSPTPLQTAKNWANNSSYNTYNYVTTKDKFTNSIILYNPNDPNSQSKSLTDSMDGLGRLLHNFQDMASPNHTRNDYAAIWNGQGGYEEYVANKYLPGLPFWQTNIEWISDDDDLWYKFTKLALFTNSNFSSENTVPIPGQVHQYDLPAMIMGPNFPNQYGCVATQGKDIRLDCGLWKDQDFVFGTTQTTYAITNKDVYHEYSSKLVPKSISYSTAVIKYFLSLKGTGAITIDDPVDNTTVYTPEINVTATMTYYASTAVFRYRAVSSSDLSRTPVKADVKLVNGVYTASASIPLKLGANTIDVDAENENVNYTSDRITVTYEETKPKDPTPPPQPPSPPGSPNTPAHPPYSPKIQGLFDSNPTLLQCVASGKSTAVAHINPNANGSPVLYDTLGGWYLTYDFMIDKQDGGGWIANNYFYPVPTPPDKIRPPSSNSYIGMDGQPWANWGFDLIALSGVGPYYLRGHFLTDKYNIDPNDPCFKGLQVPSDMFNN